MPNLCGYVQRHELPCSQTWQAAVARFTIDLMTHSTKRATASALPPLLRTTETNNGDLWVRLVTHMHDHLGQVIAYSRANAIVPPWSR